MLPRGYVGVLLLGLYACGYLPYVSCCSQEPETPDWRMTLKTIRNGIHKIDTYLNAALDLFGGDDGLCHYKCSDGYKPVPRPGYKQPPPNGCGSPLFGFQFDIGIPSMTKCCNQHDRCYDTCGRGKHECDDQFQDCLETICRNVQRTLGLAHSVQACESAVTLLFDAVMHLGCKPYLDSQRESCVCHYEIKPDLCTHLNQVENMSRTTEGSRAASVAKGNTITTDSMACSENITETDAIRSHILLDPAEEYRMDYKRRGLALIFNQERFFWRLGMNDRHGTNADRYNLEMRLKALNFEVKAYDNYKQEEVLEKIHEAAEANHSDADCFLLIFLSHGENDQVYTYNGKISIQQITSLFKGDKCKSLVGKPKIFVLQACRGDKHDDPVTACDAVDSELKTNEVVVDASAVHTLPAGADFIMCYSVAEGYYSHRETLNGSWYIQDLCELLQKYGDSLEFTELLTLVNRKVSMRSVMASKEKNAIGKKQVPCFASMLTKKLYFRPKK
ncbi:caspase-6-like [Aulostomus maculatus]